MKEDLVTAGEKMVTVPKGFAKLYSDFIEWLPILIEVLVVLIVFIIVARTVRRVVRKAMARTSTDGHVDILVAQIAYIGTLSVGIIVALSFVSTNLSALFTGLGVAGFAVGFAMKDILGNFLSGIILLIQRPFTIGDNVVIGDVEGTVTNIRIRDTQIETYDGRLIYIPNNALSTSNIINLTALPKRRVDVNVGISYAADIGTAMRVCLDAVRNIKGAVLEPAPEVLVTGFADSSVMLQVRVWVDWQEDGFLQIKSEAHKAVKEALDNAGIEIPYPVRTVYLRELGKAKSYEIGSEIKDLT
ncbi:MAG: mechanosensitive ion channel family protein [Firmicutes bacterium]|nr:mechanosensitive ion channel family protein [Bacillota bacterium]